MPFDALLSQRRHPGGDLSVNWNVGNSNFHGRRDQRSSLARVPAEKTFSLERRDILHHGSLAGEPEMNLDFARSRRNIFLALLALNKIKDTSLPVGEHTGTISQAQDRASSNEHPSTLLPLRSG